MSAPPPLIQLKKGSLSVRVFDTRTAMGRAVAGDVVRAVRAVLEEKAEVNILFAAAPSQQELLDELRGSDIPWDRVRAFHMDEYIGLPSGDPRGFGAFLDRALFSYVPLKRVYYMIGAGDEPGGDDADAVCRRYAALLEEMPLDIVLMGIGENGHLAFNDPPVADFNDPETVKAVILDVACRRQQVNDGCFPSLDDVPRRAVTLTVPELVRPPYLFCTVPGERKAAAVKRTLEDPVETACPASILRTAGGGLYLDKDSGACLL